MATTQNTFKISQLSNIKDLDASDLFLVSDHTNNNFYTRKLSAGVLFDKIQQKVVNYISSDAFVQKLAAEIAKIPTLSAAIVPTITEPIVNQATPMVMKFAVPLVSSNALPIVSAEAIPLISSETIPLVSSEVIPIVSSETIPLISDDITTLAIQDIISSDEISSAIVNDNTAIGYAVNQIVSENVSTIVTNEVINNTYTTECVLGTISANASTVWDMLDGKNDGVHTIDAGDSNPDDDIVSGGGA